MKRVAIFGSGPAGLMAADRLAQAGVSVDLHERRAGLGRKLLIAGSSGLNISHECSLSEWAQYYQGWDTSYWKNLFQFFGPAQWIHHIHEMGFKTFLGTSNRYFVSEMKSAGLLKVWIERLEQRGVRVFTRSPFLGCESLSAYSAVGLALGGGSWESESPEWPFLLRNQFQIQVHDFYSQNVGYEVDWSAAFLKETEGQPLKNIELSVTDSFGAIQSKKGELIITQYGLEGTPIYFLGKTGTAWIDLKPGLSREQIHHRLTNVSENLSPLRRIKKQLSLCEASLALLFHEVPQQDQKSLEKMIEHIKQFKVELKRPRPLIEAISSGGGVDLSEIEQDGRFALRFKRDPRLFMAGEMLNWSAPTGGFLIQACVSQGAQMAESILATLNTDPVPLHR